MTEREIFDGVIVNGTSDFSSIIETLRQRGTPWCVIDNFAINAYATSVYAAELDVVAASADLAAVLRDLRDLGFRVRPCRGSTKIRRRVRQLVQGTHPLTTRFVTTACHQSFLARANARSVLGFKVPVAALEDVVQGKLSNLADPSRRLSEQMKDRFDLLRLAEARFEEVIPLLPDELRAVAEAVRMRHLETGDNGWGDDDRGKD